MEKELFDYIAERADILATTDSSKQSTKEAALAWKNAVANTSDDAIEAATTEFIEYLDGRPHTIDDVIAFAQGPAVEIRGQEAADQLLAQQLERKEQGAQYCGCEACTAASEILAKFGRA